MAAEQSRKRQIAEQARKRRIAGDNPRETKDPFLCPLVAQRRAL